MGSASNATYVKRESAVFELLREADQETVAETIEEYFKGRVKKEAVAELKERARQLSMDSDKSTSDPPRHGLGVDPLYQLLVDKYRQSKSELQSVLVDLKVAVPGAHYSEDFYTLEQFRKITRHLAWPEQQQSPEGFFQKWANNSRESEDNDESTKRIVLEVLLSHMFRNQIWVKK